MANVKEYVNLFVFVISAFVLLSNVSQINSYITEGYEVQDETDLFKDESVEINQAWIINYNALLINLIFTSIVFSVSLNLLIRDVRNNNIKQIIQKWKE